MTDKDTKIIEILYNLNQNNTLIVTKPIKELKRIVEKENNEINTTKNN